MDNEKRLIIIYEAAKKVIAEKYRIGNPNLLPAEFFYALQALKREIETYEAVKNVKEAKYALN